MSQSQWKKGKLITFEGCEGSGKSTQIRLLAEKLSAIGVDFIVTREPGGSDVAEQIRKIILDAKNTSMCNSCEALLYAAARAQHLCDVIDPALRSGKLVVCDRYVDSSLAYQGGGRGLDLEYVRQINGDALQNYAPDLTVFLDIPPEKAFERKHGADKDDRMEQQSLDFHRRVYSAYKRLASEEGTVICPVDCSGTKYETSEKIFALLKNRGII